MTLRELLSRAVFLMTVPKCVCCNEPLSYGTFALCPDCSARFEEIKTRNCSRCARVLSECDCTTGFLSAHFVKRLIKVFRYRQSEENLPANSIIYTIKQDRRSDVLHKAKDELARAIRNSLLPDESFVFTNVPRRRAAVLEYGLDHAAELSRALAREFGCKYIPLLKSKARRSQKKLMHDERMLNADFDIRREVSLDGKTVILVDDIVTTGASMGHSAALIRSLGAKTIIGAALAIAYPDER